MLDSTEDALHILAEGKSILGPGWKAVDSFDDLNDPEAYDDSEEVWILFFAS